MKINRKGKTGRKWGQIKIQEKNENQEGNKGK